MDKDAKLIVYIPETADGSPEVRIDEQPFKVKIIYPVCADMRLVISPRRMDTMELDFGNDQMKTQDAPEVTDEADLISLGLCSITQSLTLDGDESAFFELLSQAPSSQSADT